MLQLYSDAFLLESSSFRCRWLEGFEFPPSVSLLFYIAEVAKLIATWSHTLDNFKVFRAKKFLICFSVSIGCAIMFVAIALQDSGAENSSLSSEVEEEEEAPDKCIGEEGVGEKGVGGVRRVGGGEDGGPQAKQPRLGAEEASQVMATAPSNFDSPDYAQNSLNMRSCPQSERIFGSSHNCAYFVIRRIDTDSEAEAKDSGVKEEERIEHLSNGSESKVCEEVTPKFESEEDDDEDDDEWVYSKGCTKEERDTKARKSLQYEVPDSKDNLIDSINKVESKPCARVFEALKLNSSDKDKTARIKKWLSQGGHVAEESAEEEQASKGCPIDSCDASGEYTSSGESSEVESQSSGEMDGSIATCRKSSAVAANALATAGWNSKISPLIAHELGISSMSLSPTDGDVTPVAENRALPSSISLSPTVKPVLRSKRRKMKLSSHHQNSPNSEQKRRPWSICVSGSSHLVAISSDGNCATPTSMQAANFSPSPSSTSPQHAQMHGARSTSESAIHCLAYSSSSCSTGLDDVGSAPGRAGTGSDGLTPTRGSVDGEGLGSGGGSSTGTGSLRRRKVRTRRRALGQRSESGNSDSVPMDAVRRGSLYSGKGLTSGGSQKGSHSHSTSSDYSSSNLVGDETKDEMDEMGSVGVIREIWNSNGIEGEEMATEEEDDEDIEEGEKLGSLQTEETSSFSEQAWDNYQVCLSEGGDYSSDEDKKEKEQILKRLMEFGDDYRNHFDSQSDGGSSLARQQPTPCSTLDSFPGDGVRSLPRSHSPTPPSPGSASRTGSGRRKRPTMPLTNSLTRVRQAFPEVGPQKFMPQVPLISNGPASLGPMVNLIDEMGNCNSVNVLDSDSDLEDVNHLLKESREQFRLMESYMEKALGRGLSSNSTPGKYPPHADYAEIAATCKENIKILRTLLMSSDGMDGKGNLLTPRDFWETKDLVLRWEMLESRAEECHMLRMLRQEIAALRDAMVSPSSERLVGGKVEDLQNRKELDRRIQEVKVS
ncbi:hypothetical protein J437_LFUL007010 [Ladona fulva]|uniref:Uncharacterized protein n=1 Tax=Ladona fulva TaxID=123851 RepID=A0A8K0P0A1_LADFU|nr:hypothetical protein J437_LFUL007010 [Ladona fulva]